MVEVAVRGVKEEVLLPQFPSKLNRAVRIAMACDVTGLFPRWGILRGEGHCDGIAYNLSIRRKCMTAWLAKIKIPSQCWSGGSMCLSRT